jgi:hypothetical protein
MTVDSDQLNVQRRINTKLGEIRTISQSLLAHMEQHRAVQELTLDELKTANLIAYLQLSRTTGITPLSPADEKQLEAQIRDRLNL